MAITVEKLAKLGGKVWERGDFRRVYFNYEELAGFYGLRHDGWKWTVDGEKVSNNTGSKISSELRGGKFWYDLNTGEFGSKAMHENIVAKLIERITEAIEAEAEEDAAEAEAEGDVSGETTEIATETEAGADIRTAVGYGLPTGTKIYTNRKPGYCRRCGQLVPAGEGHLYYIDPDEAYEVSGWVVEHKGSCPG